MLFEQCKILCTVLDQDSQFGKNQIFCLKKGNLLETPILHKCSPYHCLQSFSLVWFFCCSSLDVNKNEESNFSEHIETKLLKIFLNIYRFRKNKAVSADTFIGIDKKNMQNF